MKELNEIILPDNIKYCADHECISLSSPTRVGVSDFAQDQLGDITFVELPEVGVELKKGEEFGTLESTKSVSPLYMPVDGKIVAVNEALSDNPEILNNDPYGDGWVIEIEMADPAQLDELMNSEAYLEMLKQSSGA